MNYKKWEILTSDGRNWHICNSRIKDGLEIGSHSVAPVVPPRKVY